MGMLVGTATVAGRAAVPGTEMAGARGIPMGAPRTEAAEAKVAAMPAIREMLVATGTATRVGMVTATETAVVPGTGMAKAVAKPILTPGV
jgi:hypothetical protein